MRVRIKATHVFGVNSVYLIGLIIISSGIILRTSQYIFNRSLWLDELLLAENLIDRSILELLNPLGYNQGAPIGFLISTKIIAEILGYGELTLRLIPFISGVLSVPFFALLAKRFTDNRSTLIALILFITLDQLIYYSSEVKQYSSDVLFTILLLITFTGMKGNYALLHALLGTLVGAIAMLFSHPSVFVLAGIGVVFFIKYAILRQWRNLLWISITGISWLGIFFLLFNYFFQNLEQNTYLSDFWKSGMLSSPFLSLATLKWIFERLLSFFSDPLGLTFPILGLALGCLGSYKLLSHNKKGEAWLLILPAFFTLFAASIQKYPFSGRLVLFLIPTILILVSTGVNALTEFKSRLVSLGLCLVMFGALIFQPFYGAALHLLQPRTRQETRPAIEYMAHNMLPSDSIYLYYPSTHAYNYYSKLIGLKTVPIVGVKSREDLTQYQKDLNNLQGKGRVWIFFSRVYEGLGTNEETYFVSYLNKISTRLDYFHNNGASVYLYNFH